MDLGDVLSKLKSEIYAKEEHELSSSERPLRTQEKMAREKKLADKEAPQEENTPLAEKGEDMEFTHYSGSNGIKKPLAGMSVNTQQKVAQNMTNDGHVSCV